MHKPLECKKSRLRMKQRSGRNRLCWEIKRVENGPTTRIPSPYSPWHSTCTTALWNR